MSEFCPECRNLMFLKSSKFSYVPFYHWEDECEYYKKVNTKKYECDICGISLTKIGDEKEYNIPKKYLPTEKQVNFAKSVGIEPLTKHQCIRDLSEYTKNHKHYYTDFELYDCYNEADFY